MPAVETLTCGERGPGDATFLLHWRDPPRSPPRPASTAIPAGEFQPSSVASWDRSNDFSLWRGMIREFSENFWASRSARREFRRAAGLRTGRCTAARWRGPRAGRVRPYCLRWGSTR
ncbi:hypothetical protein HBB16_13295 [Pseudonocardia sp. MCCB 268]|nr:hypothetical protein [Pseudonocardia cytotoxica]